MRNNYRTIVVLSHQGMGDSLMAIPFLRTCDANLSRDDRMVILVKAKLEEEVMATVPWKGNVEVWQLRQGGLLGKLRLFHILPRLRALRPDILLAPLLVDRFANALWMWLVGARKAVVRKGKWLGRMGRTVAVRFPVAAHEAEEFLEYARAAGFSDCPDAAMSIPVSDDQREAARCRMPDWKPEQQWIAFGPGSGVLEAFKRWPPEHYAALAGRLLNHSPNIRIALVGSRNERSLLESIVQNIPLGHDRCSLFTNLTFHECFALLAQCRCMVAAAAGLPHMAASAGIPIVGIHGPANPGHSGPYSRHFRLVRLGLECSPCYRSGFNTGCGNPICMTMIQPETVFQAVLDSLEGKPCPPVPWCKITNARKPAYPETKIKLRAA